MLVHFPLLFATWLAASSARADTEIVNFRLPFPEHEPSLALESVPSAHIAQLQAEVRGTFNVCNEHADVYVRVPLTDGAWTARISWPGSQPAKFKMDVMPIPEHHASQTAQGSSDAAGQAEGVEAAEKPTAVLIHIHAAPLATRLTHPRLYALGLARDPDTVRLDEFQTDFHLLVEPLVLGFIPKTALSAIFWIVVVACGAAACVPTVIRWFDWYIGVVEKEEAEEARLETEKLVKDGLEGEILKEGGQDVQMADDTGGKGETVRRRSARLKRD